MLRVHLRAEAPAVVVDIIQFRDIGALVRIRLAVPEDAHHPLPQEVFRPGDEALVAHRAVLDLAVGELDKIPHGVAGSTDQRFHVYDKVGLRSQGARTHHGPLVHPSRIHLPNPVLEDAFILRTGSLDVLLHDLSEPSVAWVDRFEMRLDVKTTSAGA